ncbi:MAG: hypothetical protein PVH00_15545 [Gemmatimonadota bacterium]|jgi:hypothetical protein
MIPSIRTAGSTRPARGSVARALLLAGLAAVGTADTARAQGATDLFLVRLGETDGRLAADSVVRLTDRNGYDNQPQFVADGTALLYTSIDATGQADIHRLDLRTRQSTNLTRTAPESEYSATLMPGGSRMSVIRVEADSTQRLWSFRLDGSDPRLVLERVAPVGYQAWIDAGRIAVFVLGSPATLQLADVRTGETRVLASDIGRSLNRVPGRNALSFVQRDGGPSGWITELDAHTGATRRLVRALPGNEYHAWTPSGTLVSAAGSILYRWRPGDADWTPVADLTTSGVSGISRLIVSPDGRSLALVAAR